MTLRLNSHGDSVKQLQRDLNKIGSILLVDGDFGLGTRSAVINARATLAPAGVLTVADPGEADDTLQAMLKDLKDPFPLVRAPGATFIARLEVGSPRQYNLLYRHPAWPSEQSGITIGIGYDLKFVTRAQFEADWAAILSPAEISRLAVAFGVTGSTQLRQAVADLEVPLDSAIRVFRERTLPEFIAKTRSIYPQVDTLSSARATALVSLVYNRGANLEGERRREMRAIQSHLASNSLDAVAPEFDAMERLWEPTSGLVKRRHDEARLWRSGFAALQLD